MMQTVQGARALTASVPWQDDSRDGGSPARHRHRAGPLTVPTISFPPGPLRAAVQGGLPGANGGPEPEPERELESLTARRKRIDQHDRPPTAVVPLVASGPVT
jgi:hypothetical protein